MATSPEAIATFLHAIHAPPLLAKGREPAQLLEDIYNCTGVEYAELTSSRTHQLEGVAFALYQRSALLFYWMRLGKSKIALDWATHLIRAGFAKKKCLIIAHAPVGVEVWQTQVAAHSVLECVSVRSGPSATHMWCEAVAGNADIIIVARQTIQALFTFKKLNRKGAPTLYPDRALLQEFGTFFDLAIIDETHVYANPYGLPFDLVKELTHACKYRLGLTGTPIGRDAYAIWAQAYLIDRGKHFGYNFNFFTEAFGKKKKTPFSKSGYVFVFDTAKQPLLQYKLDSIALAYGKDEVYEAPVVSNIVDLRMLGQQRKAYNEVVEKLIKLSRDEQVAITNTFHKLRQIASGYLVFDDEGKRHTVHFPNSPKLAWLSSWLEELPSSTPCLIFHEYIHTGEVIAAALTKQKISHATLHGRTRDKDSVLAQFKSGRAQILVANSATGGTAIDLPEVDYMCFFESPVDSRVRAQAQARPMARGNRTLYMDDIVCAPVEHRVLGLLAEGRNLLHEVLHGDRIAIGELLRAH